MTTSRTIRVDEEVWRELQKRAVPFVDTPNDVLRKLVLPGETGRSIPPDRPTTRVPGNRTPEEVFGGPILEVLIDVGGVATANEVLERVYDKVRSRLTSFDHEKVPSGYVRWRNAAMWERKHLVERGLLSRSSAKGYWEITETGRQAVKNGKI